MPPRGPPLPALRELDLRALLTQDRLADDAGVSRQSVLRAENGEPVTPSTIKKLARALRVTPETLMGPPSVPVEPAAPRGRPPAAGKPRGKALAA